MAIVDALVTAHGGHVVLDTAPGGGFRITVSLPLGVDDTVPLVSITEQVEREAR